MALKALQTKTEYEETIKNGLTLVDFNAPWCAPCRTQEPILEKISSDYDDKAAFAAMNVDENQDVASSLGIKGIPTLIIFKNNKEIQRFVGVQSYESLDEALSKALD